MTCNVVWLKMEMVKTTIILNKKEFEINHVDKWIVINITKLFPNGNRFVRDIEL